MWPLIASPSSVCDGSVYTPISSYLCTQDFNYALQTNGVFYSSYNSFCKQMFFRNVCVTV